MLGAIFTGAALCLLGSPAPAGAEVDVFRIGPTQAATTATAAEPPPSEGLSLDALIDEAMANNLQVRVSGAQIDEARALYEFAAAQAYPRVTASSLFGGPTPEARTTEQNNPSTLTPASFEGDFNFGEMGVTFRIQAEAALPLYSFGKIARGKAAASHVVQAATHGEAATRAEVAVNVTKAFWAYQLTDSFIRSLRSGRARLEKVLVKIEELLDSDSPQVTENDRLRLKYALSTVTVREVEAETAQATAKSALRLLLSRDQEQPLELEPRDLDDLPSEVPDMERAIEQSRSGRAEILALREVVKAARTFADLRRAQFYPDVFLGGVLQYAYTSNATNQTNPFLQDPFNFFTVGVGLGVRVELDVFTKLALLERAEAEAGTREAQAELATAAAEFEVRKLHTELQGGYRRIKELDRANVAARGWLTASTLAYDIGTGQADELIDAFLAWAASEADIQKTRFDLQLKLAELARATGRL